MAKPNSYLQRQRDTVQAYIQLTCDIYSQYVADCAMMALADEFGFGSERLNRFYNALADKTLAYDNALGARTKADQLKGETEYLRAKMDEKLKSALGEYYQADFEERYPACEKVRYGRR